MQECLWCKKQFEPKRPTAKFCSTSCRVMNNRKFGKKKDAITDVQMQVLYKAVMDAIANVPAKQPPQTTYLPTSQQKPVIRPKTPQEWVDEKREIEDAEIYHKWLLALNADPYLSDKQKAIIKTA
jgi:hypothetical protein